MRTTVASNHRVGWSPQSRAGSWALALAGLALGGTVALAVAFALGLEPADGFADNWLLSASGVAVLLSGVGAVVAGVLALVRRHDRSWAVLSATAVGVVVSAATLMQVAEGLGWLSS